MNARAETVRPLNRALYTLSTPCTGRTLSAGRLIVQDATLVPFPLLHNPSGSNKFVQLSSDRAPSATMVAPLM